MLKPCAGAQLIAVEASAALSAEPSSFHIFSQQRTGTVFRILEAVIERLHDRQAGVKPDQVGEGKRPIG